MEQIIKLKNVSFRYDKNSIFNDLSININKADFIGIVGPNGSGKSTLLKLILKELKPHTGEVDYCCNFNIGYVEQIGLTSDSTFPANVFELVLLGLYESIGLFKRPTNIHKQKVIDTLKIVGIADLANKQISTLSGGQQQKVMIAKAIVSSPSLLVFDEATSGIDNQSEQEFIKLLCKLNKELKTTIIMVSHHFDNIGYLNRLFKIDNGIIIDILKEKKLC